MIRKTSKFATQQGRTLNELFQNSLKNITPQKEDVSQMLQALWYETSYLKIGKKLSRGEMNER